MPYIPKEFPDYEVAVTKQVTQMGHETALTLKEIAEKRDKETGRAPMSDWFKGVAPSDPPR